MRQPLWIVNSSLFLLFVIALGLSFLLQQKPLRWSSIEPTLYAKITKKAVSPTEIAKIYENDLFDTYKEKEKVIEKPLEDLMPAPPTPQRAVMPKPQVPSFLAPMQATLRGIIMTGDDKKNRVIIQNDRTKQESNLRVGGKMEDAQLIRIFNNRAIFIRSNGQEEVLYLSEKEAKLAQERPDQEGWDAIIKKVDAKNFIVDPQGFKEYVPSLGQFIEELDLITVYRQGKSVGTRIGLVGDDSFGKEFGLEVGDIITQVSGIPATDATKRMEIYKAITSSAKDKPIVIDLLRNNAEKIKLSIRLQDLQHTPVISLDGTPQQAAPPTKTLEDVEHEKSEIMQKKYRFAPTLGVIKKRDKQVILKKIKKQELKEKQEKASRFEL